MCRVKGHLEAIDHLVIDLKKSLEALARILEVASHFWKSA